MPELKRSLVHSRPPPELSPAIAALWWAGKDDWDKAHAIVMAESSKDCAWVHAHFHRVEGDLDNACYWYGKAQRPAAAAALAAEWDEIVEALFAAF